MASTTLADYQVIRDTNFTLDNVAGGDPNSKTLHFTVPSDFAFESGSRKPIIAFKVLPHQDCSLKIDVNQRQVVSTSFDKSHTRAYWEAFSASTAFPDGSSFTNPVPVKFFLTNGKARFGDVVIWYQIKR